MFSRVEKTGGVLRRVANQPRLTTMRIGAQHFMPKGRKVSVVDRSLFEAALIGFEQMRRSVEEKISDIRRQLGGSDGTRAAKLGPAPRRTLSAAARRRIGAAQRKRWAKARAEAKPAA